MNGLYVGLLAVIGAGGVEHVVEIARDDDERATFAHSVNTVRTLLEAVGNLTTQQSYPVRQHMIGNKFASKWTRMTSPARVIRHEIR